MSHDHSNNCSCSRSHYPDLLQKICPTRTWEVDSSPTKKYSSNPSNNNKSATVAATDHQHNKQNCKCSRSAKKKKVKGKFGVAWICESPDCSCCEPYGWQVEFTDTPSNVQQRCRDMIEWVNKPPLPTNIVDGGGCNCKKPKKFYSTSPSSSSCCCCSCIEKMKNKSCCGCKSEVEQIPACSCCYPYCCEPPSKQIENCCCRCCCCSEQQNDKYECNCCNDDDDEIPERDQQEHQNHNSNENQSTQKVSELKVIKEEKKSTERIKSQNISLVPVATSVNGLEKAASAAEAKGEQQRRTSADSGGGSRKRSKEENKNSESEGSDNKTLFCNNENCLTQVGEPEENETNKNRIEEIQNNEIIVDEGEEDEKNGKKTIDYRCCTSTRDLPAAMRKRRIWLPAEVTRIILRNLRSYLNSTLYGETGDCNDSIEVVCANKIIC